MTTATILPSPRATFFDANGNCLSGGLVHTYVPGGTTLATTWQDAAETIPNANPIVCDSTGSCIIYGSGAYQLTVTDSAGNAIPGYSGVTQSTVTVSTAVTPVVTASTLANAMIALGISLAMQPVVGAATLGNAMTTLGISTTMQGVLGTATLSTLLNTLMASGTVTTNPAVAFGPVGNAWSTLGAIVQQGTTTSTNLREFAISAGLESHTGFGGSTLGINADKVAIYGGIEGFANSGDIWALNTVTRMTGTFPATGNSLGYELDFNNEARSTGAPDGLAGFAAPTAIGLLVTGASTFSSTAAISVQGPTNLQWYRGIGVASGVSEASFYDYGTGTTGIEMQATHVGWGIDMNGSALGGAIRVPNNSGIVARNAANTADVALVVANAAGYLILGATSGGGSLAVGIVCGAGVFPQTDNTVAMGTAANRWTNVFGVTGTFTTSAQVGGAAGPTWTTGAGVPASTQPVGSLYSRTGGGVGTTLYVSQGGGTWNACAGV